MLKPRAPSDAAREFLRVIAQAIAICHLRKYLSRRDTHPRQRGIPKLKQ